MWTTRMFHGGGTCPPGPGERCGELHPSVSCRGRWDAVRTGALEWNDEAGGWIMTGEDGAVRRLSPRARYFLEQEADRIDGKPWVRWDCPWCGEPMPNLAAFRTAQD